MKDTTRDFIRRHAHALAARMARGKSFTFKGVTFTRSRDVKPEVGRNG